MLPNAAEIDLGADPTPRSRLTPQVRRDVFADAAALRLVTVRGGRPSADLLARVEEEVDDALVLFEERGWLEDPASYHETPTPLRDPVLVPGRAGKERITALSWLDGYGPRAEEPGADRFANHVANRTARAALLEHEGEPRPWVVCVHGFGMGRPAFDLWAMRAMHLHKDLGLNVAAPVLPLHGVRGGGIASLPGMPSADVLDTVHGLAQAVWDVRQLVEFLRERSGAPVAVVGLSLGGLVAATVASLIELDAVALLVPAVDLGTLLPDIPARAQPLFAPVAPLRLTPKVPVDRQLIVAGTLDRFIQPSDQAVALWRHWGGPTLHWYHGGHVSLFWARGVQAVIDDHLKAAGIVPA